MEDTHQRGFNGINLYNEKYGDAMENRTVRPKWEVQVYSISGVAKKVKKGLKSFVCATTFFYLLILFAWYPNSNSLICTPAASRS